MIGAIAVNTTTAPRRNRTLVASIMAARRGVASSKIRAHSTPFRSWGPGACRYSDVPTYAPLLFSGVTSWYATERTNVLTLPLAQLSHWSVSGVSFLSLPVT